MTKIEELISFAEECAANRRHCGFGEHAVKFDKIAEALRAKVAEPVSVSGLGVIRRVPLEPLQMCSELTPRTPAEKAAYLEGVEEGKMHALRAIKHGEPVPMKLYCPKCYTQHLDEGEWKTRLHKTHQCQACKHKWRDYEIATVGTINGNS